MGKGRTKEGEGGRERTVSLTTVFHFFDFFHLSSILVFFSFSPSVSREIPFPTLPFSPFILQTTENY